MSGDRTNGLSAEHDDATARDHLALALDLDDLVAALRMARPLAEYFSVAKVGLELSLRQVPKAWWRSLVRDSRSSST